MVLHKKKSSGPSNGWGDNSNTEGKSSDNSNRRKRGGNSDSNKDDGPGRRKGKNYFDDDNGSDGSDIPTMMSEEEDEELEPMEVQIANAPKNVDRRTVNLRDLNTEIKHALPEQAKTGADLSLLTATLCPQEVTVEPDHQWRL